MAMADMRGIPREQWCKSGCLGGWRQGYVDHPYIHDKVDWVKCGHCHGTGVEPPAREQTED